MLNTTITCDTCAADLTESGSMPKYYLTLQAFRMANTSGMEYLVGVMPPINKRMDFCSMTCLEKFVTAGN